ncbi:vWA domain-containing protein [Flavobacterium caeni]|uniref:N-terminal double-transmembrane domain-containing protein n=1 Tax=Flavobacterium caeni TaxID=490189 RepID=A0A1G5IX58_9FLAO|nr:BatA and WFA domain-containing protein [Flavobacterium caeni]SCY80209.1 N-terminal double-transmembrane domain-containing protein [Flavobacterium caeni]
MQFKHPEILYFLFLLVIPILVHLFQLRRFKKEYFTNVRLLKELSIQTRKSSQLKKYLLLATRLLLLACAIFAFAQPFFKAKDSKGATNELFIILDNSFSMQAKGQKGELMRRAVQDLLESAPENTQFSLLTNGDNFWNTDIKSIQKELQNLPYSAAPFVLEQQLAKIKSRPSVFDKDVVVITDAVGLQPTHLKGLHPEATYFIVPKAEQRNNVSVDSVYIKESSDDFYNIGIDLKAYGDDFKEVPIALYNQNKLIAKTLVDFDSKQASVGFMIPKADFHGFVQVTDNGLEYDNKLYFSISKPQKTNVLVVGEPEKNVFLSRIYTSDEFNYQSFTSGALDYNLLEKQDAVVLNELREIPQALQTTLKSFVEKGGNVVVIPAADAAPANLNAFLSAFGKIQFGALQQTTKLVTKINFNHPLFAGVFEKKIDNFQYPQTKSAFSVTVGAPAALSFEDQSAFVTALQNPMSSVYVLTAPINKDNSNFQNAPLIVPTFYNMAKSNAKTGVNATIIGDNLPFLVNATLGKDEILSVGNTFELGEKFIPVQQILNDKVRLNFNDHPQQAGNYSVYKGNETQAEISFNYPRTESNLMQTQAEALSDFKTADSLDTVFTQLQTDRTDNQLWKWFVIFALLFLATEILIQKFVP